MSGFETLAELTAALAQRRISATELLERSIARIEAFDGRLNAVVVRDFERARLAAAAADAALQRGERRPLLGIPMSVKESYNVAGLPTTWGIPEFAGWCPAQDAVAVTRLKDAGAVIIGKTNVPYGLGDWQSFNAIYGTTNNPWDLARTPGGSSGGAAASLAAGYVPLEIGSDIGGSLRAPAHYCGVFSHKPSRGALPSRGHVPPGTLGGTPDLSVIGPLARSAADVSAAFDILAGPDEAEAVAFRLTFPPPRHDALRDFRVLALDSHPLLPASKSVRTACGSLVKRLRAAGAAVALDSPLLPDLAHAARVFVRLLLPVIFARQPIERMQRLAGAAAALAPDDESLGAWRLRGAVASHRDWLAADGERFELAQRWRALFREFDVVLFPPMPTPAFRHDQTSDENARVIDVDGTPYPYLDQLVYASLATAPGLPVSVVPIERSDTGLPIGVQIIGPYLEDRTTLRFAELMEREWGGFAPPPGYENLS